MNYQFTPQEQGLFEFVKEQHGSQTRKYTGLPYWTHLENVAQIVATVDTDLVPIALCHDLLEDTGCTRFKLLLELKILGYPKIRAIKIANTVRHLTNQYTKEAYPLETRRWRKQREAIRSKFDMDYMAQTVKYADIIDNVLTIVDYDPKFAAIYIPEKIQLIDEIRLGEISLLIECCHRLKLAVKKLQTITQTNTNHDQNTSNLAFEESSQKK